MSAENWLIENYISGRLRLPDPVLNRVLDSAIALYYRFGRRLSRMPGKWGGATGTIVPAGNRLMEVHYDQPLVVFENFLGETLKYSMGLWNTGASSLNEAQVAMMDDLCAKMELKDGHSVFDIGCGFGSFAARVLERYPNSSVVGLTLSRTQADYIRDKQAEPGHPLNTPRFRLIEGDLNDCEPNATFDRIVSIGVFEHVWNLRDALGRVSAWLNRGGACLLHYIVYKELIFRFANVHMQDTFVSRNIFPDSRFWHERELFNHQQHLRIERHWYIDGTNYSRTIREWRRNFLMNADFLRDAAGLDDRKIRIWSFYFAYTSALFRAWRGRQVGNGQYLLRHA